MRSGRNFNKNQEGSDYQGAGASERLLRHCTPPWTVNRPIACPLLKKKFVACVRGHNRSRL
jgi:hypothetical protein